jgi:glycine/D-amino acid oxidase-like deaminating enzyme
MVARGGRTGRRLPPLDGDRHADVVVVGGGYTGLWTAWHVLASQPEVRVVVLEADLCGHGPSGRNGGLLRIDVGGYRAPARAARG